MCQQERKAGRVWPQGNTHRLNAFTAFKAQLGASLLSLLPLIYVSYFDKTKISGPSIHHCFPLVFPSGCLGSVRLHLGARPLKVWEQHDRVLQMVRLLFWSWRQWILMDACISRMRTCQGRTNGPGKDKIGLGAGSGEEFLEVSKENLGQPRALM